MCDRQKVIDGLELCLKGLSDICPYKDSDAPGGCRDELMYDALALLEAQEPVKPTWRRGYAYCGKCGYKLHWIVDKNNYCPECGQAVKWE